MSAADFRINAAVRKVFIRHWLELKLIDYHTINSVVHIKGKFKTKKQSREAKGKTYDVNPSVVSAIEREIFRVRGVKRVDIKLDGWVKSGGKWAGGGG